MRQLKRAEAAAEWQQQIRRIRFRQADGGEDFPARAELVGTTRDANGLEGRCRPLAQPFLDCFRHDRAGDDDHRHFGGGSFDVEHQ